MPRYASLRAGEVNMRKGPGTDFPVVWVYKRRYLPVEITGENRHWRRIRDSEGDEGWVHKTLLSRRRSILIYGEERSLYAKPNARSSIVIRAEAGVQGKLVNCKANWCKVQIAKIKAWLPRDHVWGIYADEVFE